MSRPGDLRLVVTPSDDGVWRLRVFASGGGFSGATEAWVSPEHLSGFGAALAQYPLSPANLPVLEVAYGRPGSTTEMADPHLVLTVRPDGPSGLLLVLCTLVEEPLSARPDRAPAQASFWFNTEYEALRHFSRSLIAMGESVVLEARLAYPSTS
jgi:hypothetical protein